MINAQELLADVVELVGCESPSADLGAVGRSARLLARIGFSATGSLKRSDFGISFGVPQPGSNMGVGDRVDFQIETEFTGPPLKTQKPS